MYIMKFGGVERVNFSNFKAQQSVKFYRNKKINLSKPTNDKLGFIMSLPSLSNSFHT